MVRGSNYPEVAFAIVGTTSSRSVAAKQTFRCGAQLLVACNLRRGIRLAAVYSEMTMCSSCYFEARRGTQSSPHATAKRSALEDANHPGRYLITGRYELRRTGNMARVNRHSQDQGRL